MHSDFTHMRTLQLSQMYVFVIIVILVGMSGCGPSDNDSHAQLSKKSVTTISESGPSGWPKEATSRTLPHMPPSESGSYVQSSDGAPNLALKPSAVQSQALLANQPQIGTEVGQTLPQFKITVFGGENKSTARLSNLGRPVFLF